MGVVLGGTNADEINLCMEVNKVPFSQTYK